MAALAVMTQLSWGGHAADARSAPPNPTQLLCEGRERQGCRPASQVSRRWQLPAFELEDEPAPTETLADALDAAYRTSPTIQAQRYQLRVSDEDYAQALAELRPTTSLEITGEYSRTVAGDVTQAARPLATSNVINSNRLGAQAILAQPLYTGGKAAADRDASQAVVSAGRAQLRAVEGDVFLQIVVAYANSRRDSEVMRLRRANLQQLEATRDEVTARQRAGELTRTDIAQAETQLALAQTQYNATERQLLQNQASYAALVGHDPGVLAPVPRLPNMPQTLDEAFAIADRNNPDLAQAIAIEKASRARIGAAAAEGKAKVSLRATAGIDGTAVPFSTSNDDRLYRAQMVISVPLTSGGRVRSLVSQAQNRNAVDRLGIELSRRKTVEALINGWNDLAIAQRDMKAAASAVAAARILEEGTFLEYRAGLRSTFDVLYAHGSLRDAEIALTNARYDHYIASARVLRPIGMLEARMLLAGNALYDPAPYFLGASKRGASPFDRPVRRLDRLHRAKVKQKGLIQPPSSGNRPELAPAGPMPQAEPVTHSPNVPLPGTTGRPQPRTGKRKGARLR